MKNSETQKNNSTSLAPKVKVFTLKKTRKVAKILNQTMQLNLFP